MVGAWTGLIGHKYGLPVPDAFGDKLAGSILAYTMSGGVSVVGYDAIVKTLRRLLGSYKLPEEQRQQPPPTDPSVDRTG